MKTNVLILSCLLLSVATFSQGLLKGKVIDAGSGDPLIGASILLQKEGNVIQGTVADLDGNYTITVSDPGIYTVEAQYTGFESKKVENIKISDGKTTTQDFELHTGVELSEVVVTSALGSKRKKSRSSKRASKKSGDSKSLTGKTSSSESPLLMIRPAVSEAPAHSPAPSSAKIDKKKTASEKEIRIVFDPETYEERIEVIGGEDDGARSEEVYEEVYEEEAEEVLEGGQLTAGEWNDLDNWLSWSEIITEDFANHVETWKMVPKERFAVEVQANDNRSLPNCLLQLLDANGVILWETRSDNRGKAELWANFRETGQKASKIIAQYKEMSVTLDPIKTFSEGINKIEFPIGCIGTNSVDIGFVVDATSSMSDELEYLKAELRDVIERIQSGHQGMHVRTGSVFYRDTRDEYVTKIDPLSDNISTTLEFIKKQYAAGGGDTPEAVEQALELAVDHFTWDPTATARILFLILDAPPHNTEEVKNKLYLTLRHAAEKGIKIIPISASGIDKSTEYLMKTLAISTNSTYTFLTDDSGIGNPHLEPTADLYDVKFLNDLMVELVARYVAFTDCEEIEKKKPDNQQVELRNNAALLQYVECYPNPATDFVNIRLQDSFDALIIKNALGQQVASYEQLEEGEQTIQLNTWAAGLYFLEFRKGQEYVLEKLVIQSEK